MKTIPLDPAVAPKARPKSLRPFGRWPRGDNLKKARSFVMALIVAGLLLPGDPAMAQTPPRAAPAASQPVPSQIELSKMIWSTMVAIDHANRSGNYSVLRDLGAPDFQANNDAAALAGIFSSLRGQNVDLSNALLLAPTYTAPPALAGSGMLRLQGMFGLRPVAISFDLTYQWVNGNWRLYGVGIAPVPLDRIQPPPAPRK